MVGQAAVSLADRILQDELERQLRKLLVGRTVERAVVLLTGINKILAEKHEAAAEPLAVH